MSEVPFFTSPLYSIDFFRAGTIVPNPLATSISKGFVAEVSRDGEGAPPCGDARPSRGGGSPPIFPQSMSAFPPEAESLRKDPLKP